MLTNRSRNHLQEVVYSSFITEIHALKPGNVSRYAAGHGMTVDHFVQSAELVSPILCDQNLTMGQRIHESVSVTMEKVGCNTNLGMILLFAPAIVTMQKTAPATVTALQDNLKELLEDSDDADAARIFSAISLTNPGGLGYSEKYDVKLAPVCGLLEAMNEARHRDLIAKQYVTGFGDIFSTGLGCMEDYVQRWKGVEWATVACYLTFLSSFNDSHIERQHGTKVASGIKAKAASVARQFTDNNKPDSAIEALLAFDRELKGQNINPGTSADLTAASVLIYGMFKF